MSTSYYKLCDPITNIRLVCGLAYDCLTVWENGANAGTLTVSPGVGRHIALMLAAREHSAMVTYWIGAEGTAVREHIADLSDDTVLLSEYGDVLTVAEVRARAGAKRADGYPTELFGFEDEAARRGYRA